MEVVPFESTTSPMIPVAGIPLLLAFATILGCASHAKSLRERNEEMEDELEMNSQHIRILESDKQILERTLEHMGATGFGVPAPCNVAMPQEPSEKQETHFALDDTICSLLHKTRGKYVQQILTDVQALFPDVDKHQVNSRLYTMATKALVVKKCSKGDKPRWFLK